MLLVLVADLRESESDDLQVKRHQMSELKRGQLVEKFR